MLRRCGGLIGGARLLSAGQSSRRVGCGEYKVVVWSFRFGDLFSVMVLIVVDEEG